MEFPFAVSPLTLFGRTGRRGKAAATKAPRIFDQRRTDRLGDIAQYPVANPAPFPRECGSIQTRRLGVGERIAIASDHAAVEMKAMLVAHLQAERA